MKKVFWLALALFLVLVLVAGCGGNKTPETTPEEEAPQEEVTEEEEVDETSGTLLGLGIVPSIAGSRDADGGLNAQAQTDVVMAAVLFDEQGRVASVSIDTAQTMVAFDEELQVASDLAAPGKTKKELGDEYGMKKASPIGKEWYEQIAELEDWMIGKTVEDIVSLKVKAVDDHHLSVPDDPELTSSVTVDVGDYLLAVALAYENSVEAEGALAAGLGAVISTRSSKGLDTENAILPTGQVDNTIAAAAFDENGVVVAALIDTAQIMVNFDEEGQVTSDRAATPLTKIQLGDDYGMKRASAIEKEWYEQIASFIEWMQGKTMEEIMGLPLKDVDEQHQGVPDLPELTSSVTMTVKDYQLSVLKAFENAKVVALVP